MRLLHTADWHLGRLFHQIHLTEDQAVVLDQIIDIAKDTRPDIVLIAGDIYDRSVPPPEAVALLDEVLCRLVLDCQLRVVLIAGNHDSPLRLNFASRLLADRGLHVIGNGISTALDLQDAHGMIRLYAIPYTEPPLMRESLADLTITDHDSALRALLDIIRKSHPQNQRSIVLTHAFAAGGMTVDESERPLSVGGSGAVSLDAFAGFDYTALGHLHRPQSLEGGAIRYAGSLLKYSFAESDQPKSVSLVEIGGSGRPNLHEIPLTPRRDVRRISGTLQELLTDPSAHEPREDYLEVTLQDKGTVFDAMGRLREVYPNVLHIVRPEWEAIGNAGERVGDHRALDTPTLFARFYLEVTGRDPDQEEMEAVHAVVEQLSLLEREALPA